MPASITIVCPECDKEMRAPADVAGKKIRCKGCGSAFVARPDVDEDEVEVLDEAPPKKKPAARKPAPARKPEPKKPEPKKPEPKKASQEGEDDNPYGLTYESLGPRCPDCANDMEEGDVICLHCGYNTMTRTRARVRKVRDVTPMDVFWWLLPGILAALGVLLMITWMIIQWVFLERWIDPESWWALLTQLWCRLWVTVALLFAIYKAGYFAIWRLAFNNQPPEIEEKMGASD